MCGLCACVCETNSRDRAVHWVYLFYHFVLHSFEAESLPEPITVFSARLKSLRNPLFSASQSARVTDVPRTTLAFDMSANIQTQVLVVG